MSESEAWRTITKIAAGIDRIDARLAQVEAKVSDLATAVSGLTTGLPADGAEISLPLEVLAGLDAGAIQVMAEVIGLYREFPAWAVWLPSRGRSWAAVRPASARPPVPDLPAVWVHAETAAGLADRMRVVDAQLAG